MQNNNFTNRPLQQDLCPIYNYMDGSSQSRTRVFIFHEETNLMSEIQLNQDQLFNNHNFKTEEAQNPELYQQQKISTEKVKNLSRVSVNKNKKKKNSKQNDKHRIVNYKQQPEKNSSVGSDEEIYQGQEEIHPNQFPQQSQSLYPQNYLNPSQFFVNWNENSCFDQPSLENNPQSLPIQNQQYHHQNNSNQNNEQNYPAEVYSQNTSEQKQKKKQRTFNAESSRQKQSLTKNAPKVVGKGLRQFLLQYEGTLKNLQEYKVFMAIQNHHYVVESFNGLIQQPYTKKLFRFYLENVFAVDLAESHSWQPENYIQIINPYLKGIEKGMIVSQTIRK